MNLIKFYLTICIGLLVSIACQAQKNTLFDHYYNMGNTIPTIKIDTDLKNLIKKKNKEEYQEANVTCDVNGSMISLPVKVRARGNMRKKVCYFPPVKIDFDKDHLDSLGFVKKQDDLKLVLPCKSDGGSQERLKMEHFLYDLYSVVEPYHMVTKLVNFQIHTNGKMKEEFIGFLVEDEDHYARRLNATMVTKGNIRSSAFHRVSFLKLLFFQYMIANTDWSINNRHNLEIVKVPAYKRVIPIAYDFDYAGIINQPYAVPHESLPISNVTERHFYKTAVTEDEAKAMAKHYIDLKDEIMTKCDGALYLKERTRKQMKKFIEGFYKVLKSEKSIKKVFAKHSS